LRDITKEKTLEEQQEEFISVASHELRTPLAIAEANLSNTMSSPDLPPNVAIRDPLKQAHNNIIFLSNIIDDLTTLAFAEQEALNIDLKPVLPQELVQEIVHEHAHAARAKGLQLVVANATNVRPILTSSYRIKQVLQNYVTNAIKYSDSGTITVSVDNARQEHDGVIFCVRDTGIGIPISDQKKIFTKFFRSEEFRTRKYGGTGLGLYICARLAKRLRGKVWFESELKKGSSFYLQVPPYNQDRD
jgi:signal transduction histidine kinase